MCKIDNIFIHNNKIIITTSYYVQFGREYYQNGKLTISNWVHEWYIADVKDLTNKRTHLYKWFHSIEELNECKSYKEAFTKLIGMTVKRVA